MANAYAELKRNRKTSFAEQQEQAKKLAADKGVSDPRFWKPTFDKAGRAQALIRFLPPPNGEPAGFVRIFSHYFKGPNDWYRENCLTTIGLKDPVHEMARRLWEIKGNELAHQKARDIGRRKAFISNIWVKRDPANAKAEGGVFLYQYPNAIYDMVNIGLNGTAEDNALGEEAEVETFPVFSFWDSKDFKIDAYKKGNFPQYEKCGFIGKQYDLMEGDDDALEELYKKQHSLQQFLDDKNFKSYDELKARFLHAMGMRTMDDAFEFLVSGTSGEASSANDSVEAEMATERRTRTAKVEPPEEPEEPEVKAKAKTKVKAKEENAPPFDTDDDTSYLDALMDATPKGRRK